MFGFGNKNKKKHPIFATQTGKSILLGEVPDPVFAQKTLGDGVAILPTDDMVYAPVNGTIENVASTLHAIGLSSDQGVDFLVHIGLDTVALKGEGFEVLVKEGEKVTAGTPMVKINREVITQQGYPLHTLTVITDMTDVTVQASPPQQEVEGGKTIVGYYQKG